MAIVFHWGTGDLYFCLSLDPMHAPVPKLDSSNAKEMVRGARKWSPLQPWLPHSLDGNRSWDTTGPSYTVQSLVYPKDGAHSGLKEL